MAQQTAFSKSLVVLWPYIVVVVTGTAYLFYRIGYARFDDKKNQLVNQVDTLTAENNTLKKRMAIIKDSLNIISQPLDPNDKVVMSDGNLTPGFDMGTATANGDTGWVKKIADAQVISYRGGQPWGSVFVTIGKPVKKHRHFKDFSGFKTISLELNGTIGGRVLVGLKSNTDPDDGTETRCPIPILRSGWNTYTISLKRFTSANTRRLYVVPEFVFDEHHQTISVRKIVFKK